jgi:hypothetical protein
VLAFKSRPLRSDEQSNIQEKRLHHPFALDLNEAAPFELEAGAKRGAGRRHGWKSLPINVSWRQRMRRADG